jgi:hypothetical protein
MAHGERVVRQQAPDGVLRRLDQRGRDHPRDQQVPTLSELP